MNIGEAVRSIRALSERSIEGSDALEAWYREADTLWEALKQSGDILDRMPNFISHYLSDADRRSRDVEYRQGQEEQLAEALEALEALEAGKSPGGSP